MCGHPGTKCGPVAARSCGNSSEKDGPMCGHPGTKCGPVAARSCGDSSTKQSEKDGPSAVGYQVVSCVRAFHSRNRWQSPLRTESTTVPVQSRAVLPFTAPARSVLFSDVFFTSSCSSQASLKRACRSDRVTHEEPTALRVRAAQGDTRNGPGMDVPHARASRNHGPAPAPALVVEYPPED